ncbi:MAG: hypothetical protein PW734_01165 [Verrucomicrobium sp.]|nr:hypothetical protein [Verrucomicrobium sp.]
MPNASDISRRRREKGFVLQITLPICLMLLATAAMAVVSAYQMRINSTRTSIQTTALQMQTSTMRESAVHIAQAFATTDLNSLQGNLASAFSSVVGNNTLGNFNQGAEYNVALHPFNNLGATADLSTDLQNSLSTSYATPAYPDARLALVKPGSTFIAKVFSYQLVVNYSQRDALSADTANTVADFSKTNDVTIYEIPGQFGLEGGNIALAGNTTSTVLGSSVSVQAGASVQGNVVGDTSVSWGSGATINGATLNQASSGTLGESERLSNTAGTGFNGQVSVGQQGGSAVLMQVGDRGFDTNSVSGTPYLVPKIFERPAEESNPWAPGTPSVWTAYSHPYYSAGVRILSGETLSRIDYPSDWQLLCNISPSGGNGPGGQGASLSNRLAQTGPDDFKSHSNFISVTNVPATCAPTGQALIVQISVANIPKINNARTLFIDIVTDGGDGGDTRMGTIVALTDAQNLDAPLSIVSANPLVFLTDFNTNNAPASILAPVIYSALTTSESHNLQVSGIRASSAHTGTLDTSRLGSGPNAATLSSFSYGDITSIGNLPPILLKNWLIVSSPPR